MFQIPTDDEQPEALPQNSAMFFFSPAGPSICLDDILRGVNGTGDFQFQPLLGKSG